MYGARCDIQHDGERRDGDRHEMRSRLAHIHLRLMRVGAGAGVIGGGWR